MIHRSGLAVALMGLWLLLSGHYTPLLIGLGVVSTVLVTALAHRMSIVDRETLPLHTFGRALTYIPWLALEILRSNVHVLGVILRPRPPIEPRMARFRGHQTTDLGRFVYANSITMTPGTITTGVYGDAFEVHALTGKTLDGTEEGEMDRRVVALEGEAT